MRPFKFALFVFGLMIGISFSVTPLQEKPTKMEKETVKPYAAQDFSKVEQITIRVIADLMHESPYTEYGAVSEGDYRSIDANKEVEGTTETIISLQLEKNGDKND